MMTLTRRQSWVGLGLLIGSAAALQVFWSWTDEAPTPHGDSYAYLKNLLRFLDQLGSRDLTASLRGLSVLGRPPLYQLLTVPFVLVFGRSEAAALSVNVVFIALLGVATYNLGRLARNHSAGLLAAFLVLTYPPVVHLSRMYLPHFASCAWAALSLWLLLELVERRSIAIAWAAGLSLALGLLNHPYFAWTLLGPTVAVGLYLALFEGGSEGLPRSRDLPGWLGRRLRDRFVLRGLLPAALLAVGPGLLWYLTLGLPGFRQLRGVSRLDVFVGSFHDVDTPLGWYALSTPFVISYLLTAALVAGLVMAVVRSRRSTTLLLITLATGYVFYSALPIRAWWYFCCVLPVVAVLSTGWILDLRRKWLTGTAVALTLLAGSFNVFLVTWGEAHPWAVSAAQVLGSPISDQKTCRDQRSLALCPDRVRPERWPWKKVTGRMLADPGCKAKPPCRLLIADLHGLGRAMIEYMMVRDGHGDRIVVHQLNGNQPVAFDALVLSDFIAYPARTRTSSHLDATLDFLQDPPPAFAGTHEDAATLVFPAPFKRLAKLVRRVETLSLEEVEASRRAFDLPDEYGFQVAAALSGAHALRGDIEQALELYRTIENRGARTATRSFLVRELTALAAEQDAQGNREGAIAAYEAVLQIRPRHEAARERLEDLRR